MKTFTLSFRKYALIFGILLSSLGYSQTPDFNVQHLENNIGRNGGSTSAFTAISSLNNAVALANNNRKTHTGTGSGTIDGDDLAGARQLTAANTLSFFRESASTNANASFRTSIWEYIGPAGGDNEMIVRGRFAVNLNGGTNNITQAISGITNAERCIPFITGILNNSNADDADSGTAVAFLEDATTMRVQKGSNGNNVTVYVTLVEFTGSNWTVLHGDSGNTAGDNGTITLRDNADGTGNATNVSSWNNALIFSHHRGDTNASGTNDAIADNYWPVMTEGSNNQTVDWSFDANHDSAGTNRQFVHVLSNPNMNVSRFSNTSNTQGETTIDITSAGLSNVNEALIVGSSRSSGGGTAYSRGWRNYYFNSATQAAHSAGRSGNGLLHEIQVADLSNLTTSMPSYCVSSASGTDGFLNDITRVQFNTIDNVTPGIANNPNGGYDDFTSISTTVQQGSTHNLSVSSTTANFTFRVVAYIDWNRDFDFDDAGEFYDLGTVTNGTQTPTSNSPLAITVPAGAAIGTTRIRISQQFGAGTITGPCDVFTFGEVEDYSINITGLGNTINSGDTTPSTIDNTSFGSLLTGSGNRTHSFTIQNLGGTDDLILNGAPLISITGANAGDFAVTANPTTPIAAGGNTTFDIQFSPSADGLRTATVSIANNDGDENPYTFDIEGTGTPPPPTFTIYYENFDENAGGWTASTGSTTNWAHGTGTAELAEGSYWYTDNYNDYSNNALTTVESPIISTSGFNNLVFAADIRFNLEADEDDGVIVEYRERISGSFTAWTRLGSNGEGFNWYDGSGNVDAIASGSDGWTGDNTTTQVILNSFELASINLPASLEDSAEVQFRFVFASDGATVDDGFAFDNVIIYADPITPFSDPSIGPGSMTTDLKLWLKATNELGVIADGTDISSWSDAAFDNDATATTINSPAFNDNATDNINFNPVINFDRANTEFMRGKGGFFAQDYFVVVRSNGIVDDQPTNRHQLIAGRVADTDPQVDGTGLGLGNISARFNDEVVAHMSSSVPTDTPTETSYGRAFSSTTTSFGEAIVIYNVKTNASGTATEIYRNGIRIDNLTGFTQGTPVDLNFHEFLNQQFYLGVGRYTLNGNVEAYLDGRMTEVISYGTRNDDLGQQKIQSYLALKNGITLHASNSTTADRVNDIDYIDSAGNVIWDTSANAGFNFDIAGIGRDDDSGLMQRQSASENKESDGIGLTSGFLSMSLTQKYDTNYENITNNSTNFNDRQFLTWGNNGADINLAASTIMVDMSAGISGLSTPVSFIGMQRVWKVVENGGDIPSVQISIPENAVRNITPPGSFLMFISSTPVFDPTADFRIMTSDGNGNLLTDFNFDGTKFITFGFAPEVVVERSVFFDGNVDYVDVEDHLDLNSSGYTMSAWIKRASGSANTSILSKRNAAFSEGYDLGIDGTGHIRLRVNNGAMETLTSNTVIPEDQWHHVAVIYDGSTATIYIDGVPDSGGTGSMSAPADTNQSFLIAAADGFDPNTTDFYEGNIDEVRVWDVALSEAQLRYIMNQEILENTGFVDGDVIPTTITSNDVISMPWTDLAGYYPMTVFTYTNVNDLSSNSNQGALRNLDTVDFQNAPLPYESTQAGDWDTQATWENGNELTIPGAASIVDPTRAVDWNIVRVNHDINMDNFFIPEGANRGARSLLGLIMDDTSTELTLVGNTATNQGQGLIVTHYLKLDGKLDLEGESQLIQSLGSDLDITSAGNLERDQQGTLDTYTYNYWSSPVGTINTTSNNNSYTYANIFHDGSDASNPIPMNFTTSGFNGSLGTPITLADFWIFIFDDFTVGDIAGFQQVRSTGTLLPGQGFTLKGVTDTSGNVSLEQNYVAIGKPNNGDISLNITAGNNYLVGNPYASALDADQFILDNGPVIDGGSGDGSTPTPGITGTLYFWEHFGGGSHILQEYQGGYGTYTLAGATPAAFTANSHPDLPTGGIGTKTPGRFVPVGQGFFVLGETTGTVNFNNGQRAFVKEDPSGTSGDSVFVGIEDQSEDIVFGNIESAQNKETENIINDSNNITNESDPRIKIRVGFNSVNTYHRQLLLTVDQRASLGFDWGFDGGFNEEQLDDMYWIVDDINYNIQAIDNINDNTVLPLGFHTDVDGNNNITIDQLENVPDNLEIFLVDHELNTTHDIRRSGIYEFFSVAGQHMERFEITFEVRTEVNNDDDEDTEDDEEEEELPIGPTNEVENITVFYSNDTDNIIIINPQLRNITSVEMINIVGQTIFRTDTVTNQDRVQYQMNKITTGTYIIRLNSEEGIITRKVLVD